jgi:MFS family permease
VTGRLTPGWFYGTVAFGSVGLAMTAPMTALFAKELGASDAVATVIVASITVSFLCLDLVASRVVPRVDARSALSGGYLVFGLGSWASALAPNLWVMAGARIVQGFAAAFPIGAAFRVSLRLARPGGQGAAVARFNAASFVGLTVGPLAAGAVAASLGGERGLRWSFALCGLVNVIGAAVALVVLPRTPSAARPRFGFPTRSAFAGRRTRRALLAAGLGFGLRGVVGATLLPLLGNDLGTTASMIAVATTLMAIAELGGTVCAGRWADAYGRLPVTCGSAALAVGATLVTMLTSALPMLLLMCAVLGFVMAGLYVVPAATIVDVAESDESATVGWRASCDLNGLLAAVALSAVVGTSGIQAGFMYAAVLSAAIGVLSLSIGESRVGAGDVREVSEAAT